MKISSIVALLALVVNLLFVGCRKADITSSDSLSTTVSSDATAPDLSKCKIRYIYAGPEGEEYSYKGLFSYNRAGNPYSLLFNADAPDYQFYYDAQNRLTEHREFAYGLAFRHYYKHNAAGQIVIDSSINPGSDTRDTTISVSTIEYDSQGRIIKETIVSWDTKSLVKSTRRPTYTYDNRGNIGVLGWKSSSYDYKVNPLRQNPVFQFITRNYSMNNAASQPKYNSKGLPLTLKPNNDNFFGFVEINKIIYDCQ
jgi:YD repeat-containing protein